MFTRLLEAIGLGLDERRIPYMIIGGQAVLIYGEPRLTRDIDVTLGAGVERLPEVLEFVRASAWIVLVETATEFVQRTMVLPCEDSKTGIRIDFIFSNSAYEQQAMERVRRVAIGKAAVRFASAEDVMVHKIIAGRSRDLDDVRSILLKNSHVDVGYISHWLREFDCSLGKSYLRTFEDLRQSAK